LRVLHVGSGFRPWRTGGLVAYIEDLMEEQVRRGHEVAYFFSGRQYPFARGPRLRRWERDGVAMLELVNSPLYDHGRQPELEIAEPRIENTLARVLEDLRPDAVHVQELAGLPFSVLDVIRLSGTPAIVTLQDYFPLCSTFKLLDADGRVCLRREIGADCVATSAADPRTPGLMVEATVGFHLTRMPLLRSLRSARRDALIGRVAGSLARREVARRRRDEPGAPPAAGEFQRRRDMNVERLNRADRLIAMSHRVAEIYSQLGVDPSRLSTVHLTLAHIERLRPREFRTGRPVTFATLAGFESAAKGARLLLEAIRELSGHAEAGRFRLVVLGHFEPEFAQQAEGLPGIEIRGRYVPADLDAVLDDVDVGIMSSIWEEAYGYAGIEFLAKGIPVIANAIGGMTDYTRDGETGWLNRSCSSGELARIMRDIVGRPEQVAELNAKLLADHGSIVKPLARHVEEMDALYREAIEMRRG
jgi:glycosyltransferase involved in cell wall biosynthesis